VITRPGRQKKPSYATDHDRFCVFLILEVDTHYAHFSDPPFIVFPLHQTLFNPAISNSVF
jgi:hypothetical protein